MHRRGPSVQRATDRGLGAQPLLSRYDAEVVQAFRNSWLAGLAGNNETSNLILQRWHTG